MDYYYAQLTTKLVQDEYFHVESCLMCLSIPCMCSVEQTTDLTNEIAALYQEAETALEREEEDRCERILQTAETFEKVQNGTYSAE